MPSKKHNAWFYSFHGFGHDLVSFLKSPLFFFKDFGHFFIEKYLSILGLLVIALLIPLCGAGGGLAAQQTQADLIATMADESGAAEGKVCGQVQASRNAGSYFSFASSELSYLQESFYQPRFFATYSAYQENDSKNNLIDYSPFRIASIGDVSCVLLDSDTNSYWCNNTGYLSLASQTKAKSLSSNFTPIMLSPKLADFYLQSKGLTTYDSLVGEQISSSIVSASKVSTKNYVVSAVLKTSKYDSYFAGYFAVLPFAYSFPMNQSLWFNFTSNARTNHDLIQATMGKYSPRGLYYQRIQYSFSYHFLTQDDATGFFTKDALEEKVQKLDDFYNENKALNVTAIAIFSGIILLLLNGAIFAGLFAKASQGFERNVSAVLILEFLAIGLGCVFVAKIGAISTFAQMGLTFVSSGSMYVMFIFLLLFLFTTILAGFVGFRKKERLALSVEDI